MKLGLLLDPNKALALSLYFIGGEHSRLSKAYLAIF